MRRYLSEWSARRLAAFLVVGPRISDGVPSRSELAAYETSRSVLSSRRSVSDMYRRYCASVTGTALVVEGLRQLFNKGQKVETRAR